MTPHGEMIAIMAIMAIMAGIMPMTPHPWKSMGIRKRKGTPCVFRPPRPERLRKFASG